MHIRILLTAVPLLALGACARPETASASTAAAQVQTVRLGITGMS
jgi:hypothetical protein